MKKKPTSRTKKKQPQGPPKASHVFLLVLTMHSNDAELAALDAQREADQYGGGVQPLVVIAKLLLRCVPPGAPRHFIQYIQACNALGRTPSYHGPGKWVKDVLAAIRQYNHDARELDSAMHTKLGFAAYLANWCLRLYDEVNQPQFSKPAHLVAFQDARYAHVRRVSTAACERLFFDPDDYGFPLTAADKIAAAAAKRASVVFVKHLKSGCSASDAFNAAKGSPVAPAPAAATFVAAPAAGAATAASDSFYAAKGSLVAPAPAAATFVAAPAAGPAAAAFDSVDAAVGTVLAPAPAAAVTLVAAPAASPAAAVSAAGRKRRGVSEPSPASTGACRGATGAAPAECDAAPRHKSMRPGGLEDVVDLTGEGEGNVLVLTVS